MRRFHVSLTGRLMSLLEPDTSAAALKTWTAKLVDLADEDYPQLLQVYPPLEPTLGGCEHEGESQLVSSASRPLEIVKTGNDP